VEQEAEFALVEIVDTGEIALVQQGLAEGAAGSAKRLVRARAGSQSGPSRSGPR
jgi:hypothetical protein